MTYRKLRGILLSSLAAMLFLAGSTLATTFNVPYAGKMGTTLLEAGRYKITWEENSPELTVTVAKGKTVVATVKGRLESRSTKYPRNMVVYNTNPDGSQTIMELRIGGTSTAIVFTK